MNNTYPSTPDLDITADNLVRSYDFPGDTTNYVVGHVIDVNPFTGMYTIELSHRVVQGNLYQDTGKIVYAPINGQEGIFGLTRGVQRI